MKKDKLIEYLKSGEISVRKSSLIAQKKMQLKKADAISFMPNAEVVTKANAPIGILPDQLKVRVIINTTNLRDSHDDVHLPGLWDKSLQENKMIMHLQEHDTGFKSIISDGTDLKAYTQNFTWSELGISLPGVTQALVFDSTVKRAGDNARNQFMFEQYAKGYVKNHSVGMQYVKMILAINQPSDEELGAEYEAWQKYIDQVANRDAAIEEGYFWAVKEAKIIEGSAVPIGSNWATPTLDNNLKQQEPDKTTPIEIEPSSTLKQLSELLRTKNIY